MVRDGLSWYDHGAADNPPWIKALAEVRHLACREGAIIVSIDQYAEAALGNRDYFLNRPYRFGGGKADHIPWRASVFQFVRLWSILIFRRASVSRRAR
jgi:hypothetical protein